MAKFIFVLRQLLLTLFASGTESQQHQIMVLKEGP